ncbi:MAG: ABC transporter permease [Ilumatobacter sp.]|uniref:ABC transporter permease n=1 Tax=Ilumatobacter sp. TaxID=1967498 RepID=UPI003C7747B4
MSDLIFDLISGLGIGALYAMLAAGLVVSYKGSGVINFAHGAIAMYGVVTFDAAWNRGEIFLPWVDILPTHTLNLPVRITLASDGTGAFIPALIVALLMAAFIGLAVHFLVFRPLRNAAPLGKVVASVGLLLYLQGVALLNFGTSFPQPRSVVPDEVMQNFLGMGKPFTRGTLYVVGFAILFGLVLWAGYRFTRFGLATRAAAGNEKGAVLLGYSPQTLAAINWVIASVTATLAVIIAGPIQGQLTPIGLSALIVPALAASLIGGLRSVPIAVAGGLALGSIENLLRANKADWFDVTPLTWIENGVDKAVPLIVIIIVLVLRGKGLPTREAVEEKRLPLAPHPKRMWEHALVWITLITLMAYVFENSGTRTRFANGIQNGLTITIVMLSIVLLTGYIGQISLMQMSFAGVAAFITARMMADGVGRGSSLVPVTGPGLPWPLAGAIGIGAAVLVGVVVGLPAVRIRGVQLAVVTIATAIAIQALYLENEVITQLRAGIPAYVREPTFFGADIGARSERAQNENPLFALFGGVVLALTAIGIANLRRTGVGRRFLAVRANERAAASAGINVARTKLLAFAMSAGIAGIGGVMIGFRQVEVSSANFLYGFSLAVLATAFLAGITSINGAILAGMLLSAGALIPAFGTYMLGDAGLESFLPVITGMGIIVTAIIHPEGIAPFFGDGMRHAGNWTVGAIPGAETIRSNYRGPIRRLVRAVLAAFVIGWAFFVYHAKFIENVYIWVIVAAVIGYLVVFAFAAMLSTRPESAPLGFAAAGQAWLGWVKRFGPTAVIGAIVGYLIWPLRVDTYSTIWMPILGAVLALFVRSIVRQVLGLAPPHDALSDAPPSPDPANTPIPVGGN